MKLEGGSPLKPFLGMKQKLNKSGLLIHSLGTIGSSHLGRQTQKQTFTKAQGREATLAEPGDKNGLGAPKSSATPGCHITPHQLANPRAPLILIWTQTSELWKWDAELRACHLR